MAFDPSNLSPAPWRVYGIEGMTTKYLACPDGVLSLSMSLGDAEFCSLARDAWDVMMRRGWYAIPLKGKTGVLCGWYVQTDTKPDVLSEMPDEVFAANDPFTALVEADRWYRENVEKPN